MAETQNDANTAAASSAATTEPTQYAPPESSTTTETVTANANEPTLAEVAKQAFNESSAREDAASAASAETKTPDDDQGGVRKADPTEAKPKNTDGDEEPPAADKDGQPPFHEHPRWKEMVGQRDELQKQVETLTPVATRWQHHEDFLKQYNIPPEEFYRAMDFLALMRSDPTKARATLEPLWKQLESYDPNRLPDDLLKRVEAEEITEQVARELNELRIQANGGKARSAWSEREQQQQHRDSLNQAAGTWDMARRGTDPDYKPKATEKEADGLWEVTRDFFQTAYFASPPKTTADIVKLCETAYARAKRLFTERLTPKTRQTALSSSSSSQPKRPSVDGAKTIGDTVAAVAARHGIDWQPRR